MVRIASLALAALTLSLMAAPARAQVRDTSLNWLTIHTPHFDIHYHEPLGLMARRVAAVAERAHTSLVEVLGSAPSQTVQIVLSDDSDAANGSATAIPYDVIRLYAEPPEDLSPLSEYDDWLTTLVSHEYMHVVHLDQATGVAALINLILGRVYMPNHVNPSWLLEGYAVWQESELTSGGRLRSSMWDMYLRMDALEDRLWDIDQVSSGADRWPHGNAAYLYGSHFIRFIADRYGREALAEITHEYADAILPYGINRAAEHATGHSFVDLFRDFLEERREHYADQAAAITAIGVREGRRISHHGEIARAPRWDRDGALYYLQGDNRSRYEVHRMDPQTGAEGEVLLRGDSDAGFSFSPTNEVFFSRRDVHRDYYYFSDLFVRDRETGHERRLTEGARARDPDVSPDGRWVTYTISSAATSHLMIARTDDVAGTQRYLIQSEPFEQIFTPRFSPDGRTIAFSRWRAGGLRDVALIDVSTGRIQAITNDRAQDTGPTFSPDGARVYFSSDRTGVANLYSYHLASGTLRQVTNVVSGAYQPAVSPDGRSIAYIGYTSYGFDLFVLEEGLEGFRAAPAYVDRHPPSSETEPILTAEASAYDPWATIYPRSYFLDLVQDTFGMQLGISTAGEDVAGFHSWNLRVGVGLVRGQVDVDFGYSWNRSPLGFSLYLNRAVNQVGGLEIAGERQTWIQDAIGGSAGVSYAFPRAFDVGSVHLAYNATYTFADEPFGIVPDPNVPLYVLPERGLFAGLRFGWNYSNVERYAYDISASNGRSLGVEVSLAHPNLGSQYEVVTATWQFTNYLPLFDHHVLAFRYGGGVSGGDLDRVGLFGVGGYPVVAPLAGLGSPVILGGVALRGYAPNDRVGTQFHLAQLEYRLPIVRFNRGVETLPFYLNRLYVTAFCDYGDAFNHSFDLASFRLGIGAEVFLDVTLFYLIPLTVRIGYAHGFMEGGLEQFYAHLGRSF